MIVLYFEMYVESH